MHKLLLGSLIIGVATLSGSIALGQSPDDSTPKDFDALLANGTSEYAKGKEEPIIRHFFRDRRNGFYLDIGCYLPRKASTTYYLEEKLNWRGIGVDAQKRFARAWKKHRPHSKFFGYAITDRSGETVTFYQAGPISSTERSNIEFWEKAKGRDLKEKEIIVPTMTINDLLDREGVKKIDFLSIDINGTEPTAMAGFDIRRFRPDLVHIEVHKRNREVLSEYFEKNGYRRIDEYLKYDSTNWYFTPKDGGIAE
jgi:FkbM family methyltransferase